MAKVTIPINSEVEEEVALLRDVLQHIAEAYEGHYSRRCQAKPNTSQSATFMQDILNLAETQRVTHVIHNRQADDFGRRFEIFEWIMCCQQPELRISQLPVKFV